MNYMKYFIRFYGTTCSATEINVSFINGKDEDPTCNNPH